MKNGWQTKTLGEICEIERGGSPRPIQNFITTDPKGINWIKIGDATASGKYIYKTEEKIKPEGVKRSRMVYEGDFILSNSMSFGRPYIMKTTGCIHDGWLVLHQPKVDPDYLYHVLSSDLVFGQFDRLAAGSTVRNLNIGLAKSVEIPYPPLPEQKRIVGILDEVFAGLATAKANAEKNLQNARALFESHLQSVFTQRGKGWVEKPLAEICIVDWGNTDLTKSSYVEGGKFLAVSAAGCDGRIGHKEHSKHTPVLSAIGAQCGRMFLPEEDFTAIKNTITLTPRDGKCTGKFLYRLLTHVELPKRGAAQPFIAKGDILAFQVVVPESLATQQRMEESLSKLEIETQRLTSIYEQKLVALEALKKSLLHHAFTGQLK
jgi:type I restriction enzyme S subunit